MTSVWDEIQDPLGDRLADDLREMVRAHDNGAERTQQRTLGPSDIGDPCTHCLGAKILGAYEPPPYDDPWARVVGKAIHDWLEDAAVDSNVTSNHARYLVEMKVQPDELLLPSGGRCDLYDTDTLTVIDHKSTSPTNIRARRANGPSLGHRRQIALYSLGYVKTGHDVRNVALAYWPRGGRLSDLYVWTDRYDESLATDTLARYQTLRGLCAAGGTAVLDSLPQDPDCFTCSRKTANPAA